MATDWSSLKVVDLKDECKQRGLPVSGKKADLVQRLEQYVEENEGGEEEGKPSQSPAADEAVEEEPAEETPAAAAEVNAEQEPAPGEAEPVDEEEAVPAAAAAVEPAADSGKADAEKQEQPGGAEEEQEEEAAEEAEPMEAEEEKRPAAAPAAAPAPAAKAAEGPKDEEASEGQQPAAMEEDRPGAAAELTALQTGQAGATSKAVADVDLDYGEESEGEGAATVEAAPAPRAGRAEEGAAKRKRESEDAAAAGPAGRRTARTSAAASPPGVLGSGAHLAGSGGRPSKVLRSSSGYSMGGNADKGEAPAPEDVPEAGEAHTRALRIDGFVRPFTERQVRELLSETGEVKALWMPSIKTHCYVVLDSKAEAEATRRATYQLQWPSTNPKRLAPRFVPLAEAESAIGNGAGNPDFRIKRTEEDGEEDAPAPVPEPEPAAKPAAGPGSVKPSAADAAEGKQPDRSQREWNKNRRSPSPPQLEGVRDLREMLSRRHSGAATAAAAAAGPAAAGAGVPSARPRSGGPADLPPGLGRSEREREREAERPAHGSGGGVHADRTGVRQEERVLTLDELFKKTTNKPCIYWLPLTDEQVSDKKRKAAQAAAAAAAQAAEAEAEALKGAENGTADAS